LGKNSSIADVCGNSDVVLEDALRELKAPRISDFAFQDFVILSSNLTAFLKQELDFWIKNTSEARTGFLDQKHF
jgi:hypothetical protein